MKGTFNLFAPTSFVEDKNYFGDNIVNNDIDKNISSAILELVKEGFTFDEAKNAIELSTDWKEIYCWIFEFLFFMFEIIFISSCKNSQRTKNKCVNFILLTLLIFDIKLNDNKFGILIDDEKYEKHLYL